MAEENRSHEWHAQSELLDHELDAALAKYAAVEPRAGLEDRVLAHLQEARGRALQRSWWSLNVMPAAVALTVLVVVIMTVASRTNTRRAPVIARHPATNAPSVEQPGAPLASNSEGNGSHASIPGWATRRAIHPAHSLAGAVAAPKLDQFPSPQPLSEQEKILASYVEKYPERSVLLARARTEALRKDQLEEMEPLQSSGWAADSEDQNNETTQR